MLSRVIGSQRCVYLWILLQGSYSLYCCKQGVVEAWLTDKSAPRQNRVLDRSWIVSAKSADWLRRRRSFAMVYAILIALLLRVAGGTGSLLLWMSPAGILDRIRVKGSPLLRWALETVFWLFLLDIRRCSCAGSAGSSRARGIACCLVSCWRRR